MDQQTNIAPVRAARLTQREMEILELIHADCDKGEIAELLYIGTRTVDTHTAEIKKKLKIEGRCNYQKISKAAVKFGLVSFSPKQQKSFVKRGESTLWAELEVLPEPGVRLTMAQLEVLELMHADYDRDQIAALRGGYVRTVDYHRDNMQLSLENSSGNYQKLSRAAVRYGFVPFEPKLYDPVARFKQPPEKANDLTDQQIKILILAAQGYEDTYIANEIFISSRNLEISFEIIFRKLQVSNLAQAINVAIENDIIQPPRQKWAAAVPKVMPEEKQILELLAEGFTPQQIAASLSMDATHVCTCLKIFCKKNKIAAEPRTIVAAARALGIVPIPVPKRAVPALTL